MVMGRVGHHLRSLWPSRSHILFPERRRHTRILTLKNAAIAAVALAIALLLLSLWSEHRPPHSGNSVLQSGAPAELPAVERAPFDVVPEGSPHDPPMTGTIGIDATTTSDVAKPPARPAAPATATVEQKTFEPRESQLGKGQRIVISGGTEGVQLHVAPPPPQPNGAAHP